MKHFMFILLLAVSLWCYKQYRNKDLEIRRLNHKIAYLEEQLEQCPSERQQAWVDSCYRAVNMTCFYSDCAVTPIEIIQEKLCRLPEGL